jgi:hypothetical protein
VSGNFRRACLAEARTRGKRAKAACQPKLTHNSGERRLERETGIEPATNSLEGCDSTTELLPPTGARFRRFLYGGQSPNAPPARLSPLLIQFGPLPNLPRTSLRAKCAVRRADGEGRIRTSEATGATDLQSVAFDRFATSPPIAPRVQSGTCARPLLRAVIFVRILRRSRKTPGTRLPRDHDSWSWRRDLNPRPADYKSAALPD